MGCASSDDWGITDLPDRITLDGVDDPVIGARVGGGFVVDVHPDAPLGDYAGTVTFSRGGTVTTGSPDFDIQWRASTNPVFASGVVRTDASGVGRFSFVVPSTALGEAVLVELVDWTSPTSIGVAGGPVPSGVPAGEGSVPLGRAVTVALLALGTLVVSMSRRPRRSVIG